MSMGIHAQRYLKSSDYAHQYDTRTTHLNYLQTAKGMGIEACFSKTSKQGLISQYNLSWDNGEISDVTTKFNCYSLSYSLIKPLYNTDNRRFFVNAGGGGYMAYETIKNNILDEKKNNWSPGAMANVEVEYYIQKMAIFSNFQQIYRPMSDIGDWQWRVGIGVKYVIN